MEDLKARKEEIETCINSLERVQDATRGWASPSTVRRSQVLQSYRQELKRINEEIEKLEEEQKDE